METSLREAYSPQFVAVNPSKSAKGFKSIVGCSSAKEALTEVIAAPLLFPYLVESQLNFNGVLLFGLVGIGKTTLARASVQEVSNMLNTTIHFVDLNIEEVESSYRSETEKNISKLFGEAKLRQPAVILIDEVDGLMRHRSEKEDDSNRRSKSVLLKNFSDLAGTRVTIIGMTNRVNDLDAAFVRRFQRRVFVDLPDDLDKERMLKQFLSTVQGFTWPDVNFAQIAEKCERFSGSEIYDVARRYAHIAVREKLLGKPGTKKINDVLLEIVGNINPANQDKEIIVMKEFVRNFATDGATPGIKHRSWFDEYGACAWPFHLMWQIILTCFL